VQEEVHVINSYPAQLPKTAAFIIKIAGFPPGSDFGVGDLFHLVPEDFGEKLVIAGFFKGLSHRREEFGFLLFSQ
jgi:hypothetical protein